MLPVSPQNMPIHGNRDEGGKYNFFILAKNGAETCITVANLAEQNIEGLEKSDQQDSLIRGTCRIKIILHGTFENNQLSAKGVIDSHEIAMKSGTN